VSDGTPTVVAIFGPTGSGKTDVAVAVARALGTEVVNCEPAQ
jgi:tRNA A37 N6-isopentenylltransferase MiaA